MSMKEDVENMNARGMVNAIAQLGLERDELGRTYGTANIGGYNIPYEPKELAGMITMLRSFAPKRYLAIEGASHGGAEYIALSVDIPSLATTSPKDSEADTRRMLKGTKDGGTYDLISIDPRGLPLSANEIWRYVTGWKDPVSAFGKGAARDYGQKKTKPGTIVIFNLADAETKELYFKVRTLDNKLHQSTYAGMVRL